MKITFLGAGSTVFARNVIGDCMCAESLKDSVFALYDIDAARVEESRVILEAIKNTNYSRLPVKSGDGVVGILKIRNYLSEYNKNNKVNLIKNSSQIIPK